MRFSFRAPILPSSSQASSFQGRAFGVFVPGAFVHGAFVSPAFARQAFIRQALALGALGSVLLLSGELRAQMSLETAPTIGYTFGIPLDIERTPDLVNRFGAAGYGASRNHALRLGGEFELNGLGSLIGGLALRVELTGSVGGFSSETFSNDLGAPPGSPTRLRQFVVESTTLGSAAELRARFSPLPGWNLSFGPTISYRFLSDIIETERIVDDASPSFEDGTRERIVARDGELASAPLRYGLVTSIAPDIRVGERMVIRPSLEGRYDFLAMDLGARALSGGAGVSILLDAPPELPPRPAQPDDPGPELPPPADTPRVALSAPASGVDTSVVATAVAPPFGPSRPEELPPTPREEPREEPPAARPVPRLSASIDLFAVDDRGRRVERALLVPMRVTTRARHYLAGIISFDSASSELGFRYRLLGPDDVAAWAPPFDGLRRRASVQTELLNVLGDRLRHDPRARVRLEGFAGTAESDRDLVRARLDGVRRYLVETWGIDARSVEVVHPATTSGASPRPAIGGIVIRGADGSRPVPPLLDEWRTRVVRTPRLDMAPSIEAEAGLRRWELVVSHMGRTIARRSSDGSSLAVEEMGTLDLPDSLLDRSIPPIVAELTAEDTTGAAAAARDEVPMEVVGSERVEERRVDLWTMHVDGVVDGRMLGEMIADAVAGLRASAATITVAATSAPDDAPGAVAGGGSGRAETAARMLRAELGRRRRTGVEVRVAPPLPAVDGPGERGLIEIKVEQ